jgi:metal-responsive CopG/Arc/MetJ family transcriptional regulator
MTMRKQYDFSAGRRGAITPPAPGKTRITIRLDDDLLDWFRGKVDEAGGGNYQTLINDALRKFIATREQPLERVLRKVLREELHRRDASRRLRSRKAA